MQNQKRHAVLALSLAATALSLLSGCATVTTGSSQSVTVNSTPDKARCTLHREGEMIGAISSTPGSVLLDKSKHPITIRCEKDGHMSIQEVVDSDFQGATMGNILLGGVIGLAIDAGSGAMNKYPNQVDVVLIPESFVNTAQRDQFFDQIVSKIRAGENAALGQVEKMCSDEHDCARKRQAVEAEVSERLHQLERQRASAKVG